MIDTYGNKSSSHVSLGAPFLRAGYVRLDFENNQIVLGSQNAVNDVKGKHIIHPVLPPQPPKNTTNDTKPVEKPDDK